VAFSAFIDESGQLGHTPKASDHFVLSAVVCRDKNLGHLDILLADIRDEIGRLPGHRLSWKSIKKPHQRRGAVNLIGKAAFIQTISVVVCKRHLVPPLTDTKSSYLFTLRFLLERLSWLSRRDMTTASWTVSHVKHLRRIDLGSYESKLRLMGTGTEIDWDHLDPYGGRISGDTVVEPLQLADLVASATARAFEPSRSGPPDQTYLYALIPRLMRGNPRKANVITSYGLKMHPWNMVTKPLYPWVSALR
jgi:hypothetical protein